MCVCVCVVLSQTVQLTTDWQRFSLTTERLPGSQNAAYAVGISICTGAADGTGGKRHCYGSVGAQKNVEVWMDGASVTVAAAAAGYTPHHLIEVGGHAGDNNSLQDPQTPTPLTVFVRNNNVLAVTSVRLSTTVLGPGYQRVLATQRCVGNEKNLCCLSGFD